MSGTLTAEDLARKKGIRAVVDFALDGKPERGTPLHWRSLGHQPARIAASMREALLASTACGTAQAVCESASWRKLNG